MNEKEKYVAAVQEYLRRIRLNNLSERTAQNYESILRRFGEFSAQQTEQDMFVLVELWRDALLSGGTAPSSVSQYLTTLKIFFEKASKRSFPADLRFTENPVEEDMFPKVVKRPYEEALTDDQVICIYAGARPPHFPLWDRNFAMLCILLNEKLRNAELLDLRLTDLDFLHHEITVRSGKGRKFRVVDMSELTEQAVARYLDSGLRPAYLEDEDYLFGTTASHERGNVAARSGAEKWHRGTGAWLSSVIERTVRAVTGVSDCRSHDLRHVGARVCLNAGQSIEELQGQLGHSSVTTTEIYTSRLLQRRRRDSAKAVLAARDAAAEALKKQNAPEQNILPLFA